MTTSDPLVEKLRAALEAEAPAEGEDAMLARAIDAAMTKAVAAAPPPSGSIRTLPRARTARHRTLRVVMPLAAAFAASIAMGAIYVAVRAPGHSRDTERPATTASPTVPAAAQEPSGPARAPAPVPVIESAPAISVDDLPSAPPRPSVSGSGAAAAHAEPPAAHATAAELFHDANAARRAGEIARAIELYKALLARHAGTPEAAASRVSLGRLLLDRQGDTAGALAQFDAYLEGASSDRSLAEEARLGRALVFQRQGNQVEERRAWKELLDRHPDSLHAARARERLAALAPVESPPAPSAPSPSSPSSPSPSP